VKVKEGYHANALLAVAINKEVDGFANGCLDDGKEIL